MFKPGSAVRWSRNSKTISGVVAFVIPAGKSVDETVPAAELSKFNMKMMGHGLPPRIEESYLIEVRLGDRGIRCLYWPSASALEADE